eukprot:gene30549-57442_t
MAAAAAGGDEPPRPAAPPAMPDPCGGAGGHGWVASIADVAGRDGTWILPLAALLRGMDERSLLRVALRLGLTDEDDRGAAAYVSWIEARRRRPPEAIPLPSSPPRCAAAAALRAKAAVSFNRRPAARHALATRADALPCAAPGTRVLVLGIGGSLQLPNAGSLDVAAASGVADELRASSPGAT